MVNELKVARGDVHVLEKRRKGLESVGSTSGFSQKGR